MPELPEVETARRLATRVAVGRRITEVWCAPDPIVYEGVSAARVRAALVGRRVRAARRHGKHFWLELDRPPALLMHFGMTGGLHVPQRPPLRLRSTRGWAPPGWPPRFAKLMLTFDDGGRAGAGRRPPPGPHPAARGPATRAAAGRPRLRRPPRAAARRAVPRAAARAHGTDEGRCCSTRRSPPAWATGSPTRCSTRRGCRPTGAARTLTAQESARLRSRLRAVLATAVRVGADGDRFPRGWLFHHRWDHDPLARTARGERMRWETIAGRTAAWVPAVQR